MNRISDEKTLRGVFYKSILYMMLAGAIQYLQDVMIQFFLARTVGVDGVAAYGIVYPILALMIGLDAFLVAGVLAICSRDSGSGDFESAAIHLSAGITWAFIIMGAFAGLCTLFRNPLVALLGATGKESYLAGMSKEALVLGTFSGPGFCALCILITFLYFSKDRGKAIALSVQTAVIEFVATAAFSLTRHSMVGVLMGYNLGIYVALAIMLIQLRMHRDENGQPEAWTRIRPMFPFRHVSLILQTGLPEMTAWGLFVVMAAIRNLFILRLGASDAVAAITLSEGINQFGEMLMASINNAAIAMIGAAWAVGSRSKYDNTLRVVWKYGLLTALVFSVIQAVLAYPMIRIFVDKGENDNLIHMVFLILIFYCIGYVFYIANILYTSIYESIGRLAYAHLNYALEYFALYLIVMFILGMLFGITGVWVAFPVTEFLTFVVNTCLAWKDCGHFPVRFEDLGFYGSGPLESAGDVEGISE